jgi:unsaturated rhamnogalacturonyl hydrolase
MRGRTREAEGRRPVPALIMKARLVLLVVILGAARAVGVAGPAPDRFLASWPERATSPQEVGRRVAQRFLASPHALWPERGTLSYSEVCVWYGALTFAQLTDDAELSARLVERLETLLAREPELIPPVDHVDNSVFGVIPLEAYRQTKATRFRALGLAFADGQWDHPTVDGLTSQTRFWIDDMYMITALQTQAYRATGDIKYLDRTAQEMVVYLDRLQQPNGLFFHTPDAPFSWGRGNGWMAAGMTELLRALPENHPARARILAGYRRMMATLLECQGTDGLWRQLVDHPEAWGETSCSGMFTFALITGVRSGWLEPEQYGAAARRGWLALARHIDGQGDVDEVCVGTPAENNLRYYLDRPRAVGDFHGQAPLLWCASALLR